MNDHENPTTFFKAIALKRHGHDVSGCDYDCGGLHHWDHCTKCRDNREAAELFLSYEGEIRLLRPADRTYYGYPTLADVRWAKRILGALPNRCLCPVPSADLLSEHGRDCPAFEPYIPAGYTVADFASECS